MNFNENAKEEWKANHMQSIKMRERIISTGDPVSVKNRPEIWNAKQRERIRVNSANSRVSYIQSIPNHQSFFRSRRNGVFFDRLIVIRHRQSGNYFIMREICITRERIS